MLGIVRQLLLAKYTVLLRPTLSVYKGGVIIFDESPREILCLLLSSTAHKYYISEIVKQSELSWPTVSQTLKRLEAVGVVQREEERFQFDSPFREARVYYTLNPELIDYFRLPSI